MGEKINFLCRNIPSNVCSYSILKALAPNTPPSVWGAHTDFCPEARQMGRGRDKLYRETWQTHLSQVIKVNINSDRSC